MSSQSPARAYTPEIVSLYESGKSSGQVAAIFCERGIRCSDELIRAVLREAGVTLRNKSEAMLHLVGSAEMWGEANKQRIKALCEAGKKPMEIMREMNLPCRRQTLQYRLRLWGFQQNDAKPRKPAPEPIVIERAPVQIDNYMISFPENPRLQAKWQAALDYERAERGRPWALCFDGVKQ